MKMNHLFFIVLLMLAEKSIAQGCSDAGFCTIGNIHPGKESTADEKKQQLSLILSSGIGDEKVFVFTPGIQYDNKLNSHWAIQAKLTGNYANGNLGNASGLGDVFLSGIYSLNKKNNWNTSFLLGTKLPLNNSNLKAGNKPLPLQYQSSLGTVDIITGLSTTNNKWFFAAALQQPLTGTNGNNFLPAYWNTAAANKYTAGNDFKRKGDFLLRANYTAINKARLHFNIGLLGIYHLGRDTYIDGNISNQPIELKGSEGITLNGTAALRYKISTSFSLGLSGGIPLAVRDIRPDGLTRKFTIAPEIIFKF